MKQLTTFIGFAIVCSVIGGCSLATSEKSDTIVMHQNQEEDYFKQLSLINEAVRKNLDKPLFYYKRAYFFWENNKLNQAIKDIETALQLDPQQGKYHYLHARILKNREEYPQALQATEKALQLGVQEAPLYVLAVELYYRENSPSEAQRFLRLAESFELEMPELLYWKARLALDRQDTTAAFPILRQVITKDPTHQESRLALANYFEKSQQPKQAMQVLVAGQGIVDVDAEWFYRIAKNCELLYGSDSAYVWYRKAAELPRTNFEINKKVAEYLIGQKQYVASIPFYEKALLQNPNYAFGHFQLGYIYEFYQGNFERAKELYEKANALKKDTDWQLALQRVERRLAYQSGSSTE